MGRIRTLAQTFHEFVTNHVAEQDEPGVADGDDGYATSTKIGMLLLKEEIDKPLRDVEDYLNEMPGILDIFGLDKSPDHTSFSNWDKEFPMQELRRLLRASAEQAGLSGTASVDASGFQRDQASSHYRNRVGDILDECFVVFVPDRSNHRCIAGRNAPNQWLSVITPQIHIRTPATRQNNRLHP